MSQGQGNNFQQVKNACSQKKNTIINVLYVITSVAYILLYLKPQVKPSFIWLKALPTVLLVIKLFPQRECHKSIVYIMLGQLFGMGGDVFLQIQGSAIYFYLGMLSFLIGHIFYTLAYFSAHDMILVKASKKQSIIGAVIYAIIILVVAIVNLSIIFLYMGIVQKVGFTIYAGFLTFMHVSGFYFAISSRNDRQIYCISALIYFGSLLFLSSDLILSQKLKNDGLSVGTKSTLGYFVLLTYYIAQFLIAEAGMLISDLTKNSQRQQTLKMVNAQQPFQTIQT